MTGMGGDVVDVGRKSDIEDGRCERGRAGKMCTGWMTVVGGGSRGIGKIEKGGKRWKKRWDFMCKGGKIRGEGRGRSGEEKKGARIGVRVNKAEGHKKQT